MACAIRLLWRRLSALPIRRAFGQECGYGLRHTPCTWYSQRFMIKNLSKVTDLSLHGGIRFRRV